MRTCVYPGSFDPFTIGHHDVLERAVAMFDRVYVSVLSNTTKRPVFSVEERVDLIKAHGGCRRNEKRPGDEF